MSRYDRYDIRARAVLVTMQDIVACEGRTVVELPDLARAILLAALPEIVEAARVNEASLNKIKLKALYDDLKAKGLGQANQSFQLSADIRAILDLAEELAAAGNVQTEHLLRAAWPGLKEEIAPYFVPNAEARRKREAGPGKTGTSLTEPRGRTKKRGEAEAMVSVNPDSLSLPSESSNQEQPIFNNPDELTGFALLETFGRELTAEDELLPLIGRDKEINELASILMRYLKPNVLILGESGVGKTALVEGLAQRIRLGKVPDDLKNMRIFCLDIADLTAGTTLHGSFEERIVSIIEAAEESEGAVLFIDEIQQIFNGHGNESVIDLLKPSLARGTLRLIGACTNHAFHREIEKDHAFMRRFQVLYLQEPDRPAVFTILKGVKHKLEKFYKLSISDEDIERALSLADRFLPGRHFPDKAIDLLDRAASLAFFAHAGMITDEHLETALNQIGNLRFESGLGEITSLKSIEQKLQQEIIGQEAAISALANVLRVAKKRLDLNSDRPDGAFLFTGPTGVGKTALAASLARKLTGREDALFRIDMSEFAEGHSLSRLIGAPPGYIGYGEMGLLSKAVLQNSGGVILLDEFEKAHPQVHRMFLQILDAGRFTDSNGNVLSFGETTIIATCNVGSHDGHEVGFTQNKSQASIPLIALKRIFPIELLNRFDVIIPFNALEQHDFEKIIRGPLLEKANKALLTEYKIELELSPKLEAAIIQHGASSEFGARNLERAFRDMVLVPLAEVVDELKGQGKIKADLEEASGETKLMTSDPSLPTDKLRSGNEKFNIEDERFLELRQAKPRASFSKN